MNLMRWTAALAVAAILAACQGAPDTAGSRVGPDVAAAAIDATDFQWVPKWAPHAGEEAMAVCPRGWSLIGGGSNSSDGTRVGTGAADFGAQAWVVKPKPGSTTTPQAFASCASPRAKRYFKWEKYTTAPPPSDAGARCGLKFPTMITGFDVGIQAHKGFASDYPDFPNGVWWARNGVGTAWVSCASKSLSITESSGWGTQAFGAGCASLGSNYVMIAGSDGDAQNPGQPDLGYPGANRNPPLKPQSWWVQYKGRLVGAHAACLQIGA